MYLIFPSNAKLSNIAINLNELPAIESVGSNLFLLYQNSNNKRKLVPITTTAANDTLIIRFSFIGLPL